MDEKLIEFANQLDLPVDVLVNDMQAVGLRNNTIGAISGLILTIVAAVMIIFCVVYNKEISKKKIFEKTSEHDDLYFGLLLAGGLLMILGVPIFIITSVDIYNWTINPLAMAAQKIFGG